MNSQEVLKKLQEQNFIISLDAAKLILGAENPAEYYTFAVETLKDKPVLQAADFDFKKPEEVEKKVVVEFTDFKPYAKEYDSDVKVMKNYMKEESVSFGKMTDFVDYFRSRYNKISEILKTRNTEDLISVEQLHKRKNMKVKLIVIVSGKSNTKNGHMLLKLEDLTGSITALISNTNQELLRKGAKIMGDEVILIEGKLAKDLFIVDNFWEPDMPLHEFHGTQEEFLLATVSDIHVGSKLFLSKNFNRMIDWLNGRVGDERQRELAGRVKYLTVAGDIADGIGVYPGQETEINITDLYSQYAEVERLFMEIPEYIHIVMAPGDHDAVKKADPQPRLSKDLMPQTYNLKNFTFISSPGMISLTGVKTLVYHGTSFVDFVSQFSDLTFENCAKAMVEMLKKRHIHPLYGGKPITPEKDDFLVIDSIPDIFHTGESHNNSYEFYKGTVCVNSGTWQGITNYILKQGFKVTPATLPLIDMKRGKISVMHFDREEIA